QQQFPIRGYPRVVDTPFRLYRLDNLERRGVDDLDVAVRVLIGPHRPDAHVELLEVPTQHRRVGAIDDGNLRRDGPGARVDDGEVVLDPVRGVSRVAIARELDAVRCAQTLDGAHDVLGRGIDDIDTAALLVGDPDVVRALPVAAKIARPFRPFAACARLHADFRDTPGSDDGGRVRAEILCQVIDDGLSFFRSER